MTWDWKREEIQKCLKNVYRKQNSGKVLPFHVTFGRGGGRNGQDEDSQNGFWRRIWGVKKGSNIKIFCAKCSFTRVRGRFVVWKYKSWPKVMSLSKAKLTSILDGGLRKWRSIEMNSGSGHGHKGGQKGAKQVNWRLLKARGGNFWKSSRWKLQNVVFFRARRHFERGVVFQGPYFRGQRHFLRGVGNWKNAKCVGANARSFWRPKMNKVV